MISKQEIINEIGRAAAANGGKPLGFARFVRETGLSEHDLTRYWARYGDALQDAGFAPNEFRGAYSDEFLIEKIIALCRKLKRFPTYREISVERTDDPDLPNKKVFARFGSKQEFAQRVSEFCTVRDGHQDVLALCTAILRKEDEPKSSFTTASSDSIGEVYLFKHGRYFKIGKTNDTVRRGAEIPVQLPEKLSLVHSIRTDDPSGVEAYWHRRFEPKRLNGEWFDLSPSEVKAFKCWRRII